MNAMLVSLLVRSLLVGALGMAALALLRRRSAALQHVVAAGAVAAMVALPLLSALLPIRQVESEAIPVVLVPLKIDSAASYRMQARREPVPPRPWPVGVILWGAGTSLMAIRIVAGMAHLRRSIRRGRPLALGGDLRVLEDPGARVPMTAWWGRNYVLLPPEWKEWPEDRLDRVVAHERAHVARGDWFTHMFVLGSSALLWPNPLVHLLAGRVRALAERAADDHVLRLGSEPSRYASDLLDLSRGVQATPPLYGIPMAAKADVARRIEMILNKKTNRRPVGVLAMLTVTVAAVALSVPLASWAFSPPTAKKVAGLQDVTFTIKARVYSVATRDPMMMSHQAVVKAGTACTDCHRSDAKNQFSPKMPLVYTVSKEFADRMAESVTKDGGVLLMAPTILTRDGQKASINVSATDENKRTTDVEFDPHATGKNSAEIGLSVTQSIDDRVVSKMAGTALWEPGRTIVAMDKDKRRLAIVEVKLNP